jgi:hypothetical protein
MKLQSGAISAQSAKLGDALVGGSSRLFQRLLGTALGPAADWRHLDLIEEIADMQKLATVLDNSIRVAGMDARKISSGYRELQSNNRLGQTCGSLTAAAIVRDQTRGIGAPWMAGQRSTPERFLLYLIPKNSEFQCLIINKY